MKPSINSPYSYRFGEGQPAIRRPSIGRRMSVPLSASPLQFSSVSAPRLAGNPTAMQQRTCWQPRLRYWVGCYLVPTTKPSAVAATSIDPTRQLAPLASTLDVVRRSVEQLAAKQEQMAQNIAALRAVEEDARQKISSAPSAPAPAQQAASIPQPKPPQAKIDLACRLLPDHYSRADGPDCRRRN